MMQRVLKKLRVWSFICARLTTHPATLTTSLADVTFLSDEETLAFLKKTGKGIVRYGDGELNFIAGYPAIHQRQDKRLRRELTHILADYNNAKPYLLAIPLDILLASDFKSHNASPRNWRAPRYIALPFLKRTVTYSSPFCFRPRNSATDREARLSTVLSLLAGKDIIYVGPRWEHVDPSVTITSFIEVPDRDAFRTYSEAKERILAVARTMDRPLVIISAGVTATVLAAELNEVGIRAYDFGSFFRVMHTQETSGT